MLQGTKQFTVSTKVDKNSNAKVTALTVVLDGCPEDVAVGLAIQHLVVRLQGSWRNKGIPAKVSVNMKDYVAGIRRGGAMTEEQAIEQVMNDPTKRVELLRKLQALERASQTKAA